MFKKDDIVKCKWTGKVAKVARIVSPEAMWVFTADQFTIEGFSYNSEFVFSGNFELVDGGLNAEFYRDGFKEGMSCVVADITDAIAYVDMDKEYAIMSIDLSSLASRDSQSQFQQIYHNKQAFKAAGMAAGRWGNIINRKGGLDEAATSTVYDEDERLWPTPAAYGENNSETCAWLRYHAGVGRSGWPACKANL